MSRVYFVHDGHRNRRLDEEDMPLLVGGAQVGDIVLPGLPADARAAYIGLAEGHAFIQPTESGAPLFHNHERLITSTWLKSGDLVEAGDWQIHWVVKGDQVDIHVHERPTTPPLEPPAAPPPTSRTLPEAMPVPAAPGRRTLVRAALAGMALLLPALAFVLLAAPVTLHFTPEPEQYSLEGLAPTVPVGSRRLALPGEYVVTAAHAGYRPLRQRIEVARGAHQVFELKLEELPGRVAINLQPAVPFRLLVNGEVVETDDRNQAQIPGGHQRLQIETDRYLPVETGLEVAGKGRFQALSLVLRPAWARVAIDSEPPGATVTADGQPLGRTPLVAELMQGAHTLVLGLEGYKERSLQQQVLAGVDVALDGLELQPLDGHLNIASEPAAASVTVDGTFHGATPLDLALPSGVEHRLRLSKPGYEEFEMQLTLAADEQRPVQARLQPQYGIVFVTARPADARLRVDGKDIGTATQRLRLATRRHVLEFSKPGYVTRAVDITPRAGISQNLDVTLETLEEQRTAQRAALPAVITSPAGQQLRLVRPQGNLRMGASRREAGRRANESRRLVQLRRPFYLGATEVSNAQYRQYLPSHNSGKAEGASLDAGDQPVVNVSWDDAARYCNWLSKRAGLAPAYVEVAGRMQSLMPMSTGYRLATEAEWSYVARKHDRESEQRYPWDGGFPPNRVAGNFADASIADTLASTVPNYNDGYRVAAPAGSFPARPAGFFDLGGNVAEWMHDFYTVYPGEAGTPVTDPLGPPTGDHHVVRDSSWRQGGIAELRLSYRDYSRVARPDLGFRVARYAE